MNTHLSKLYLMALSAVLVLVSCSKEDKGTSMHLTVEQTEYSLGALENKTSTVSFMAPADWQLSVICEDADVQWLNVSPASGTSGTQTVGISASDNCSSTPRTAYIDIACGGESVRLTVVQEGISDNVDFADMFDPIFAQVLEEKGYFADAENITSQEMSEIASVTELDVELSDLTSLRGVEYFESLEVLYCGENYLTSLNLSNNTRLKTLFCYANILTSLDLSSNTQLDTLACGFNQLTELDLSANTLLTLLYCDDNQLTELDLSNNALLESLSCDDNQITELDLSNNTLLESLSFESNMLEGIDLSKNIALMDVSGSFNDIVSIDVSNCRQLESLKIRHNYILSSVNVNGCTELKTLYADDNMLTELDLSTNTQMELLWCENNPGNEDLMFPVTVWADFDMDNIPSKFTTGSWEYEGKTITVYYRTAEPF